jgi:hypothetical protein
MRIVLGVLVLVIGFAIVATGSAPRAHACSAGPDFDPVAQSDAISVVADAHPARCRLH